MRREGYSIWVYLAAAATVAAVMLLCALTGSVSIPLRTFFKAVAHPGSVDTVTRSILFSVRLPRVLCVALSGGALALGGAAMQGLLRNPLADGSTLGVSSGAALGAVLAIALGFNLPGGGITGTALMAMIFAFLSLLVILGLAALIDAALSTNTIILIGVIYAMFVSSINSLIVTFAGERVRTITFWTMGSLAGSTYGEALLLLIALGVAGGTVLGCAGALNAFAVGEENARHVGVPVRRMKLTVLVCVSALIGVSVSVGGTIGFVGLVMPHITRMLTGPNHKKLLPLSMAGGAIFLLFSDLAARTVLSPRELPIGVVTSLVGAVVFVVIFYRSRRAGTC